MDVRKTEEFKQKHKEMMEKRLLEETSAVTIARSMITAEELRNTVYEKANIGGQGPFLMFAGTGGLVFLFSFSGYFRKSYPQAYSFLRKSFSIRIFIFLIYLRFGLYSEQVYFEAKVNPVAFDDYIAAYNKTQELMERRLARIDWSDRLRLNTGINLKPYTSKIKEFLNSFNR